jgi:hypothetical protein
MPTPAKNRADDTAEIDRDVAAAEAGTVVIWRGEHLPLRAVPERIGATGGRDERDRLFGAYREALEALNPRYERRLAAWVAAGDLVEASARDGLDPRVLVADLERLVLHSETPYYASLRRYLALIDIEQGDATVADLWHVTRGSAWAQWFGEREVRRAAAAVGRDGVDVEGLEGWRAAEAMLAGPTADPGAPVRTAEALAFATLAGSPEWLGGEVGVATDEIAPMADFAAFVRLWRLRRDIGRLQYELRLFAEDAEPAVSRAYFSGIVGHMTGVMVPEEAYLHDIPAPFASATAVEAAILAAQLVESLEHAHGTAWWRDPAAAERLAGFGETSSVSDALAYLGYDALDWRPVLRQIRTRLIGEMSGYGGPNITTRAGTRKV